MALGRIWTRGFGCLWGQHSLSPIQVLAEPKWVCLEGNLPEFLSPALARPAASCPLSWGSLGLLSPREGQGRGRQYSCWAHRGGWRAECTGRQPRKPEYVILKDCIFLDLSPGTRGLPVLSLSCDLRLGIDLLPGSDVSLLPGGQIRFSWFCAQRGQTPLLSFRPPNSWPLRGRDMPPIHLVKPLLFVLINHGHIHTGRISTQSHLASQRRASFRCNSDG